MLVTFVPKDAECAVAGIGLQQTMRHGDAIDDMLGRQIAETLSAMRGRPFETLPVGGTWHVFKWVTNHQNCYQHLATSASEMEQQLDRFTMDHPPLQAWSSQCTWVPLFDRADSYERTVYEDVSVLNWFRGLEGGGLDRAKMTAQWCANSLRMVTPRLWLGRDLASHVNRAELDRVAEVTEANGVYKIALRPGRGLDELELALLHILPVESTRISML